MSIFQYGKFNLHSGNKSSFKIDCDYLHDDELQSLASLVADWIPITIGQVEGVPKGGLRFAAELSKYSDPQSSNLIIVDDVLTTGKSMEEHRNGREAFGIVIFSRTSQKPDWITSIFTLHQGMQFRSIN